MALFSGVQGVGYGSSPTSAAEADKLYGSGNWYTGGQTGTYLQKDLNAPTQQQMNQDHWSYYGSNPMEAAQNRANGMGPMTDAQRAAAQAPANPRMPDQGPTMPTGGPGYQNARQMAGQNYGVTAEPLGQRPNFATGGQHLAQPQPGHQAPTQNPYMQQMFDSITGQVNNNLQRNVLPQIDRNAVASGNYSSSRRGIAQGLAIGDAARAATDAMANYGFQQFNNDRNYNLQSDALDLNAFNANQNWANIGAGQQLNTL